ncbi:Hypothetical Protein RradSPS_2216 [Rubrobacter radiotolerans]|uniref:Uncharacterized protein n=1 Tax=Rubrobacter radiotolerans TaxID=42256 RepID=A0A023X622_RUBRA|nr:hypothetical protein [Rubrobacter radiotolerans]AHY47499.1 Hypothetical Protein RradSPS_2216 [Rubrobacter radiotolerans]MDX5894902.1 hypothetical protein [Rubrobacter radiotolerans]SMC07028.1 conserved hypothetical protein [Rubrobacter radiotolerans DSM 5868]
MSVRDQERRERELTRRMEEAQRKADRHVGGRILAQQEQADRRADEVVRRIEKGDVRPRSLPGKRKDSVESAPSAESAESTASTPSS